MLSGRNSFVCMRCLMPARGFKKAFFLFLLAMMTACSGMPRILSSLPGMQPQLLQSSYGAADDLHDQLEDTDIAGYPMLVASFVNSGDFERTSNLGRLLSEQVASRLSQHGYAVKEIQLREDELAVRRKAGVFALSRNLSKINPELEALSILVGTYTVIERQIYVNVRVLNIQDGVVLASSDFRLPYIRQRQTPAPDAGSDAVPSAGTRL